MIIKNLARAAGTGLLALSLLLLVFLLLGTLEKASHAQTSGYQLSPQQPNFYRTDTNNGIFPLTLTNGQAVQYINGGIVATNGPLLLTVRQDKGLSVFVDVISSNACLSPNPGFVTLGWDVGPDRVRDTTTQPLKWTIPTANVINNTPATPGVLTTNTYWTNWPSAVLSNVRTIQLTTATNELVNLGITTNTVTLRIRYSYSGT